MKPRMIKDLERKSKTLKMGMTGKSGSELVSTVKRSEEMGMGMIKKTPTRKARVGVIYFY